MGTIAKDCTNRTCSCMWKCWKSGRIFEHTSKGITTDAMGYRIIDPVGTMLSSEGTCVATGKGVNPDLRRSLYSLIGKVRTLSTSIL